MYSNKFDEDLSFELVFDDLRFLVDEPEDVRGKHRDEIGSVSQDFLVVLPVCLLYTSPSPRDLSTSRMPSSA